MRLRRPQVSDAWRTCGGGYGGGYGGYGGYGGTYGGSV